MLVLLCFIWAYNAQGIDWCQLIASNDNIYSIHYSFNVAVVYNIQPWLSIDDLLVSCIESLGVEDIQHMEVNWAPLIFKIFVVVHGFYIV